MLRVLPDEEFILKYNLYVKRVCCEQDSSEDIKAKQSVVRTDAEKSKVFRLTSRLDLQRTSEYAHRLLTPEVLTVARASEHLELV